MCGTGPRKGESVTRRFASARISACPFRFSALANTAFIQSNRWSVLLKEARIGRACGLEFDARGVYSLTAMGQTASARSHPLDRAGFRADVSSVTLSVRATAAKSQPNICLSGRHGSGL